MKVLLVLALLFVGGCASCRFVDEIARSDAEVIPYYLEYVRADPELTPDHKLKIFQDVGRRLAAVQREAQSCEEQRQLIEQIIDELRGQQAALK